MAASIYDNRRQGIQSKGKRDLVRFALSGLSCMCAATGKLLYFNICSLRKLNCLHFIWNLRVLRFLEGTSCLFDRWIRHRNGILECYKHSCGQITWWNHNVEEYIGKFPADLQSPSLEPVYSICSPCFSHFGFFEFLVLSTALSSYNWKF